MKILKHYFLFVIILSSSILGQFRNDLLFEETRVNLNNAISQKAHILSQSDFNKSAEHYLKAQEILMNKGNSSSIKEKLEESIALLTLINEDVERSREFFLSTLNLRDKALTKNANKYAPYYWNLAEENLFDAIEEFKDRNYEEASELLPIIAGFYSRAEAYSERVNSLLTNWAPIKNADNSISFLLSPNNYDEGLENYFFAIEMLCDGKETTAINERITKAANYFDISTRIAIDFAKVNSSVITSREEAGTSGAEKYAAGQWLDAEKLLRKAGDEFECKDYESAKYYSTEAMQAYKFSKHIAVKERFLFTPRQKIKLARENNADEFSPKSYDNSVKLYFDAQKLIDSDRYTESEVASIASRAEVEADKASWIAGIIKSVEKEETTWEDLILNWNIWTLINKQTGLYEREKFVKSEVKEKLPINRFSKYISDKSYVACFPEIDMEMLDMGDKLLLRVYNVNFRPAGWKLNDGSKSVLTQLMFVLEDIKGLQYQINSFTDDVGAQRTNLEISDERAKEIVNYFNINSSYLSGKMIPAGYGEKSAIANNNNFEGRMKNNRIEILISD
jgi:outer membrane protein OmpA-like peptidoglycan-associated protein